jgi:hypothetical protein
MMHNDPVLWAEFTRLAALCEELRKKARELTTAPDFPKALGHKADLLAYNLGESRKVAQQLAGERPEEVTTAGAAS